MSFDPRRGLSATQRGLLAAVAFLVILSAGLGILAWLAPGRLDASFVPLLLLAVVGAYASWRWSRDRL